MGRRGLRCYAPPMRLTLPLAVLLATGLLASPTLRTAQAQTAPDADHLAQLLSGFEDVPSDAQLRALGPDTVGTLAALYNDSSRPGFVRLRSVAAAGAFHTEASRTFLRAVLSRPGQSDLFIREGLLSLGRAFGDQAVAEIAPFLSRPETVVREAAVISLSRIHSARALQALRPRLTLESDPGVRRRLEASL